MDYNHETMFEGVKNAWCDGGGCHWCGRDTRDPMKGHDGFCPVPAMFALDTDISRLMDVAYGRSDVRDLPEHLREMEEASGR